MIWLLALTAFAQDPTIEVVQEGEAITAEVKSFLLPEVYYDQCLVKAERLRAAEAQIGEMAAASSQALGEGTAAIQTLQAELRECGKYEDTLRAQVGVLTTSTKVLKARNRTLVAGTIILGVVAGLEAYALGRR